MRESKPYGLCSWHSLPILQVRTHCSCAPVAPQLRMLVHSLPLKEAGCVGTAFQQQCSWALAPFQSMLLPLLHVVVWPITARHVPYVVYRCFPSRQKQFLITWKLRQRKFNGVCDWSWFFKKSTTHPASLGHCATIFVWRKRLSTQCSTFIVKPCHQRRFCLNVLSWLGPVDGG